MEMKLTGSQEKDRQVSFLEAESGIKTESDSSLRNWQGGAGWCGCGGGFGENYYKDGCDTGDGDDDDDDDDEDDDGGDDTRIVANAMDDDDEEDDNDHDDDDDNQYNDGDEPNANSKETKLAQIWIKGWKLEHFMETRMIEEKMASTDVE